MRQRGYVRRDEATGRYWLSPRVRSLSDGFTAERWVDEVAMPPMARLGQEILWPISFMTPSGSEMLLRATTDLESPMASRHAPIGFRMPILCSSSGWSYLAHCEPQHRSVLIDMARRDRVLRFNRPLPTPRELDQILERARADGYATFDSIERVSNIAVPVFSRGRVFAALVLRYFSRSLTKAEAVQRYVSVLRETADEIGLGFDACEDDQIRAQAAE